MVEQKKNVEQVPVLEKRNSLSGKRIDSIEDGMTKLKNYVKQFKTSMLTTVKDDRVHSRPMQTQPFPFDGKALYYLTKAGTGKVQDLESDTRCNVLMMNSAMSTYVSITGHCSLMDREEAEFNDMKEKLWTESMKSWFPEGKYSSDIQVMKVTVEGAQFWDEAGFGSKRILNILGLGKAKKGQSSLKNNTVQVV